jgi:hypothetical protein
MQAAARHAPPGINVQAARVVLRQRSFIDVLDLAVRFIAAHAGAYARTFAVVIGPAFLCTWLLGQSLGWVWGWVLTFGLSLFAGAPFTVLASRLMFSEKVRVRDAIVAALAGLPRLIGARVIHLLAVMVGTMTLFVPAIWAGSLFLFLPEAILLEQATSFRAVGRTARIASSQVGSSLLVWLLLFALAVGAPFLVDATGRTILEDLLEVRPPDALTVAGGGALSLLGFWLTVPFSATVGFLFYIDLRTRGEGWDIQTMFAAIARRQEEQSGA